MDLVGVSRHPRRRPDQTARARADKPPQPLEAHFSRDYLYHPVAIHPFFLNLAKSVHTFIF